MLEAGLWLQGFLTWQLVLIESTLPIVKSMLNMMKCLPETNEAESMGSALFISDDRQHFQHINDAEVTTMPYGTVKWFNTKTGAGYIRTDRGENVLVLNGNIRDSDRREIHKGARVSLDVLKDQYGLLAINVRSTELSERQG
jgi:cold shock CspA family protein